MTRATQLKERPTAAGAPARRRDTAPAPLHKCPRRWQPTLIYAGRFGLGVPIRELRPLNGPPSTDKAEAVMRARRELASGAYPGAIGCCAQELHRPGQAPEDDADADPNRCITLAELEAGSHGAAPTLKRRTIPLKKHAREGVFPDTAHTLALVDSASTSAQRGFLPPNQAK